MSSVKHANLSKVAALYSGFAKLYDALLGDSMFPLVRRNFEWLVGRYGVRFRAAADVACGTGTFVGYLRRWDVPVFGVDRSISMLRIAIQKNQGNGAKFLRQDLRQLQLPYPVDLITCHFDSLNYLLSTRDLALALCRFRTNLTRGGHAIFDMVTDISPEPELGVNLQRFELPGVSSIWEIAWDLVRKLRIVTMHNFFAIGAGKYRREREVHAQRQYPVSVVVGLLVRCGFTVRNVHDASSLMPATPRTYRAVYVVRNM
ncbi:MAG: class I SAM-dependent methyltransferase [Acidobacteria bacterium]|nr:class I SAM-dependent methyltransferase [Acidobacteriota bacterium]